MSAQDTHVLLLAYGKGWKIDDCSVESSIKHLLVAFQTEMWCSREKAVWGGVECYLLHFDLSLDAIVPLYVGTIWHGHLHWR